MLRYCTKCRKDYDFSPADVSGPKDIYCPVCQNLIPKNSRHPVDRTYTDKVETNLGNAVSIIFRIAYVFYMVVALIGVAAFLTKLDIILYVATGVALFAFVTQLFMKTLVFRRGLILLPIGALIGFLIFRTPQGACLGVNIVFLIRHLIRDIIYRIVHFLVKLSRE